MKKLFCFFLLVLVQLNFAQQSDKESDKQQSSSAMLQAISVTIGGQFLITGSFTASRFQRLDHFITTYFTQAQLNSLNGLTKIEDIKAVTKEIGKYALRDITLKRANGEVTKIDLLRFRFTGDFKYNPYLMNDDVIIFPTYDEEVTFVDVTGAVNKPTKFQFVSGDNLQDAILFSGGLNKSYDNIEKAEISRLDKTGNKEKLITVNIKDEFPLESGDRIRILADENQKKNFKVLVLGQVKTPGYIYITRDGMSLQEVINKAGGFNENADLKRAEVIRDYSSLDVLLKYHLVSEFMGSSTKNVQSDIQIKQLKETLSFVRLSNVTPDEDTLFFRIDNQLRVLKSENLVDFSKITDPNSDESKFIVKDDDMILIPDKFDYVYVFGQVPQAGYVKYEPGKDYKYYIDKSGGLAETARSLDNSVIIKGKERNWISDEKDKVSIEPGDFIYVPKEAPRSFWYTLTRIGTFATILSSAITIVLLIIQLGK